MGGGGADRRATKEGGRGGERQVNLYEKTTKRHKGDQESAEGDKARKGWEETWSVPKRDCTLLAGPPCANEWRLLLHSQDARLASFDPLSATQCSVHTLLHSCTSLLNRLY